MHYMQAFFIYCITNQHHWILWCLLTVVLPSIRWVKSAHCHRLQVNLKIPCIPWDYMQPKVFSFKGWFPYHFMKPHPNIYWNSAGKEQRRWKWEKSNRGRKEGNTKLLRKKKPIKPGRKILDRYPEAQALCAESRFTVWDLLVVYMQYLSPWSIFVSVLSSVMQRLGLCKSHVRRPLASWPLLGFVSRGH